MTGGPGTVVPWTTWDGCNTDHLGRLYHGPTGTVYAKYQKEEGRQGNATSSAAEGLK
ncbi:hypothetical protein NQZ68_037213 [Dissostichus eleginoides]|nr:hypothetical protein NQZ68_037213 [Dissostichus eleginoides]